MADNTERWGTMHAPLMSDLPVEGAADLSQVDLYRCRKCRRLLATSQHAVQVEPGPRSEHTLQQWKYREGLVSEPPKDAAPGGDESSLFVEPLSWMSQAITGTVQGKLYCPGCKSKLGAFNWSGITNADGAWVTPAFQLHLSRLDAVQPLRKLEELTTVRRPLLGPAAATQ